MPGGTGREGRPAGTGGTPPPRRPPPRRPGSAFTPPRHGGTGAGAGWWSAAGSQDPPLLSGSLSRAQEDRASARYGSGGSPPHKAAASRPLLGGQGPSRSAGASQALRTLGSEAEEDGRPACARQRGSGPGARQGPASET